LTKTLFLAYIYGPYYTEKKQGKKEEKNIITQKGGSPKKSNLVTENKQAPPLFLDKTSLSFCLLSVFVYKNSFPFRQDIFCILLDKTSRERKLFFFEREELFFGLGLVSSVCCVYCIVNACLLSFNLPWIPGMIFV
jgi:hypothetical protein